MKQFLRTFACDQSGAIAVPAMFLMMISAGMVAFTVDMGSARYTRLKLQNIADAAALGAVLTVHNGLTAAQNKALQIAKANAPVGFGTVTKAADVSGGQWDKIGKKFTKTDKDFNAIEVTARRTAANGNPLSVFFSRLLRRGSLDLSATAVAMFSGSPACILVLDPTGSGAFTASGSSELDAACALHVNSTAAGAAQISGGNRIAVKTSDTCVRGTATGSVWSPAPMQGTAQCPLLADPLASVPEPKKPATCTTPPNLTSTLAPGCHTGSFRLSGDVNLAPGLYYFINAQIRVGNNTNIRGTGVTLYVDATTTIDLTGASEVILTADTSVSERRGILIFGTRSAKTTSVTLAGNSRLTLDGTLYTPSSPVFLSGSTDLTITNELGGAIVRRLELKGSSRFVMDGRGTGTNASIARHRASLVD